MSQQNKTRSGKYSDPGDTGNTCSGRLNADSLGPHEPSGKKIQIITNLFPLPWEPNRAVFNRQQFAALSRRNRLRVTVVIGWLSGLRRKKQLQPVEKGNLRVNYLRYFYIPAVARFTHAATLYLALLLEKRRIRAFKPDCLLISWAFPEGVAGVVLARSLGLPVIVKIHGSDVNMHLLYPARARQIIWALRKADAVVPVSAALAKLLVEHGVPRTKVHTLYNGLNHQLFHPTDSGTARRKLGLSEDRMILLFIGNLKTAKGCEDLLDAFIQVSPRCPDLDLYFIGSGPASDAIRSKVTRSRLDSRVTLLGSVDHADIPLWINACNLVSLPSHNEGIPNVLLEAMACGKPVVATRVGGIPEIVPEHAGILVERENPVALAEALLAACSRSWDPDKIADSVKGFNWELNAQRLDGIIDEILHNRSV